MPKVYAYLRKVPIQRQYLVSYPYGVGGDTLLDRLLGMPNFDNWLITSILSYFSARFILTPFGVPSLLSLLTTAFNAVTGRSLSEESLRSVTEHLIEKIETVGDTTSPRDENTIVRSSYSRQKRSSDTEMSRGNIFSEIVEIFDPDLSFNKTFLSEMSRWVCPGKK